jgi:hypothetical protein
MSTIHTAASLTLPANSPAEIANWIISRRLTWLGPLLVVTGRSIFLILAQAVVALIFLLRGNQTPWRAAAPWWSIYGNLVDLGCLALILYFTRKEGLRLRDLVGPLRWRWGFDLFLGILLLLLVAPCFMLVAKPASLIAFGTPQPYLYPGLLTGRVLPLWSVIYSFSVFLLIWSPTEEITYQGYSLPRIFALSRRRWVAVLFVSFWWSLQHSFIPLIPDWRYIAWRFLAFWPAMIMMTVLYLWLRRLPPLIVAHWALDTFALMITLKF